jgi:hypothetical protein
MVVTSVGDIGQQWLIEQNPSHRTHAAGNAHFRGILAN